MNKEKYNIESCEKCPKSDHEGIYCRCEPRNIAIAKMIREKGTSPWHKIAKERRK